jgi:hypothetical protein
MQRDLEDLRKQMEQMASRYVGGGSARSSYNPIRLLPANWQPGRSWGDTAQDGYANARSLAADGSDLVSRYFDRGVTDAAGLMARRPVPAILALLGIGIALGLMARK